MSTTTMTRRTALAGAAAGTMIPVAGLAKGAGPDPAVLAYREWLASHAALKAAGFADDDTPEGGPLWERYDAAEEALAEVVPTTPEGLACKVRYACDLMADPVPGGGLGEPEEYQHWSRPCAPDFIDSLLAYAERLAAEGAA